MSDCEFHCLHFVGTDGIDFFCGTGGVAVNDDQRCGKGVVPVPEEHRVDADPDCSAELDSRKLFQIFLRQNLNAVTARREFMSQLRQHHFHIALDRIDGFIGDDHGDVAHFSGKARVIAVLSRDGEHMAPHILAYIRVMTEYPRHGGGGDSRFSGDFLKFHVVSCRFYVVEIDSFTI